jgi:hypothetical protein
MIKKLETLEKRLQSLEGARITINRFDDSPFYKEIKKMLKEGTIELKKDLDIF